VRAKRAWFYAGLPCPLAAALLASPILIGLPAGPCRKGRKGAEGSRYAAQCLASVDGGEKIAGGISQAAAASGQGSGALFAKAASPGVRRGGLDLELPKAALHSHAWLYLFRARGGWRSFFGLGSGDWMLAQDRSQEQGFRPADLLTGKTLRGSGCSGLMAAVGRLGLFTQVTLSTPGSWGVAIAQTLLAITGESHERAAALKALLSRALELEGGVIQRMALLTPRQCFSSSPPSRGAELGFLTVKNNQAGRL